MEISRRLPREPGCVSETDQLTWWKDVYTWNLFDYSKICQLAGAKTTQYLKIWADLNVQVETAASLTLIVGLLALSDILLPRRNC